MTKIVAQTFSQQIIIDKLVRYFNDLSPSSRTFGANDLPLFKVQVIRDKDGKPNIIVGEIQQTVEPENYIGESTFMWIGPKGVVATATRESFFEVSKYINTGVTSKKDNIQIKRKVATHYGLLPKPIVELGNMYGNYMYEVKVVNNYGYGTGSGSLQITAGYNEYNIEFSGYTQTYLFSADREDEIVITPIDMSSEASELIIEVTQWHERDYGINTLRNFNVLSFNGLYDSYDDGDPLITFTAPAIDNSDVYINDDRYDGVYAIEFTLTSYENRGWDESTKLIIKLNDDQYTLNLYDGDSQKYYLFVADGDHISVKYTTKNRQEEYNAGIEVYQYIVPLESGEDDFNREGGTDIVTINRYMSPGILFDFIIEDISPPILTESDYIFKLQLRGGEYWKGDYIKVDVDGDITDARIFGGDSREVWIVANEGQTVTFTGISKDNRGNKANLEMTVTQWIRGQDPSVDSGEEIIDVYSPLVCIGQIASFITPWTTEQTTPHRARSYYYDGEDADNVYRISLGNAKNTNSHWDGDFIRVYVDDTIYYQNGTNYYSDVSTSYVNAMDGQHVRVEHVGINPKRTSERMSITQFKAGEGPSSDLGTIIYSANPGDLPIEQGATLIEFDAPSVTPEAAALRPITLNIGDVTPDYKLIVNMRTVDDYGWNSGSEDYTNVIIDGVLFPLSIAEGMYATQYELLVQSGQRVIFNHKNASNDQQLKVVQYHINDDVAEVAGEVILDIQSDIGTGQLAGIDVPWNADQDITYVRPEVIQHSGTAHKYLIELLSEDGNGFGSSRSIGLRLGITDYYPHTLSMSSGTVKPYIITVDPGQHMRFELQTNEYWNTNVGLRITQFLPDVDVKIDAGTLVFERLPGTISLGHQASFTAPWTPEQDLTYIAPMLLPGTGEDYKYVIDVRAFDVPYWNWRDRFELTIGNDYYKSFNLDKGTVERYELHVGSDQEVKVQFSGDTSRADSIGFKMVKYDINDDIKTSEGDVVLEVKRQNVRDGELISTNTSSAGGVPYVLPTPGTEYRYIVELSNSELLGWKRDFIQLNVGSDQYELHESGTGRTYEFTADGGEYLRMSFGNTEYDNDYYGIVVTQWEMGADYTQDPGLVVYNKPQGTKVTAGHVISTIVPFVDGHDATIPIAIPIVTTGTDYMVEFTLSSSNNLGWNNDTLGVYINGRSNPAYILHPFKALESTKYSMLLNDGDEVYVQYNPYSRYNNHSSYERVDINQWTIGSDYTETSESLITTVNRGSLQAGFVATFNVPWDGTSDVRAKPPTELNGSDITDHVYHFELTDRDSDGWHGAYILITHNGKQYTMTTTAAKDVFILRANAGDSLHMQFVQNGSRYTSENGVVITRYDGELHYSTTNRKTVFTRYSGYSWASETIRSITVPPKGE